MRRVHAVVSGEVQGVGYRYLLRMQAGRAGVAGWVRNRPDGTVEAELEGDDAAVAGVLEWMRHGPSGAVVASVDSREVSPTGDADFAIRS